MKGRLHYFGAWEDPQGALERWLEVKDDLLAGRTPRVKAEGTTIAALCNAFLTFKAERLDSGELGHTSFQRYYRTCELLVSEFGKNRAVADCRPDDFRSLRATMTKRLGPVALGNEIQIVRSIFLYGHESDLIEKPVKFGPGFRKPSAKTLRQNRTKNGPKMFTPGEIKAALAQSTPNMRAMILLGANGGLGNTDLGTLPRKAVDLGGGWLSYARKKTGVARRIPLWPETIDAIRTALAERSDPKDPADADLLFIGKRGQNYTGNRRGYRVTQEMTRILKTAGVEGRTFYDLRRTFQTIAEDSGDSVATSAIMGHAPRAGDMASVYRQRVSDDRLQAVVDHVRRWLFGTDAGATAVEWGHGTK